MNILPHLPGTFQRRHSGEGNRIVRLEKHTNYLHKIGPWIDVRTSRYQTDRHKLSTSSPVSSSSKCIWLLNKDNRCYRVQSPGKHHFNQVFEFNISVILIPTNPIFPDTMHCEGHACLCMTFPSNVKSLSLIMREYQTLKLEEDILKK